MGFLCRFRLWFSVCFNSSLTHRFCRVSGFLSSFLCASADVHWYFLFVARSALIRRAHLVISIKLFLLFLPPLPKQIESSLSSDNLMTLSIVMWNRPQRMARFFFFGKDSSDTNLFAIHKWLLLPAVKLTNTVWKFIEQSEAENKMNFSIWNSILSEHKSKSERICEWNESRAEKNDNKWMMRK